MNPIRKGQALPHEEVTTEQGYALWAGNYDQFDNPLIAMSRLAMKHWSPNLQGARVLELGCGTGRNASFFLAAGAKEYVGVDSSQAMLTRAQSQSLKGCQFLLGEIARPLGKELGEFDLIFFCLVLEHVCNLTEVLKAASQSALQGTELRAFELHPALWQAGTRAHLVTEQKELRLPSFAHSEEEFRQVGRPLGWELERATSWYGTQASLAECAKLRKHLGEAVLLEIGMRKAG